MWFVWVNWTKSWSLATTCPPAPLCLGKLDQIMGFGDRLSSSPSHSNIVGFPTPLGLFGSEVEVQPCHRQPRAPAPSREERKSACTSGLTVCFLVILQRMHVSSMWPRADVMKTMKAFSWIAESRRQRGSRYSRAGKRAGSTGGRDRIWDSPGDAVPGHGALTAPRQPCRAGGGRAQLPQVTF